MNVLICYNAYDALGALTSTGHTFCAMDKMNEVAIIYELEVLAKFVGAHVKQIAITSVTKLDD